MWIHHWLCWLHPKSRKVIQNELIWIKMLQIMCLFHHSQQIWTLLNTYGRFWKDVFACILHHHRRYTNWGTMFRFRKDSVPSLQNGSRDVESMTPYIKARSRNFSWWFIAIEITEGNWFMIRLSRFTSPLSPCISNRRTKPGNSPSSRSFVCESQQLLKHCDQTNL